MAKTKPRIEKCSPNTWAVLLPSAKGMTLGGFADSWDDAKIVLALWYRKRT